MQPAFFARLINEVSLRILCKAAFNLCFKGALNLLRFERRLKDNKPFFPGFIIISVTSKCNLSCQGCWVSNPEAGHMPFETLCSIIDSCRKKGSFYFGLVGGEPLLYPHLIEVLEKYPDCFFQIFTNGTQLDLPLAKKLSRCANATPLISIEGLEEVSDRRRGGKNVYVSAIKALENCKSARLPTGVATSVCKTNLNQLATDEFIKAIIEHGAHYIWYYIYRPVGPRPHPELALSADEIIQLRQHIVDARVKHPIAVIDAYWDADGKAICPGASGLSHHISSEGHIEFCPPLQFYFDQIGKESDLIRLMQNSHKMAKLRKLVSEHTSGCIILSDPELLYSWLTELNASDSSGRGQAWYELKKMCKKPCHHVSDREIPERNLLIKLAKRFSFFGISSYG